MASLWDRARAALGFRPSTGDVALEDDRIVLRELDRAKAFPQEPRDPGRKEMTACERCSGLLRRVVFTTAGNGAHLEIWRQYPLAVDGWLCPGCGWAAMPRFISAEESTEYGRAGAEHAANGRFDDAEFWFRRIIGSWPGYPAGYADLGQLASARADAADTPEEKRRLRAESASWFRRAVEADAERRLPQARVALARALALTGDERGALELLDSLAHDPATAAPLRAEAEKAMAGIREGRALFQRATEMVGSVVLEPPSLAISAAKRRDLEAAEALLCDAADRSGAFPHLWFLGKVRMRLGALEAALAAFRRAHAVEPTQPDGCRELGSVLLELDRADEALPIVQRALELRPEDAGLKCNVALVRLLTGDVAGARAQASAALARDPGDEITRALVAMIDDVAAGRRARPRSLAEAEGRKR
jgi:tetratricopeptide (TPR) repeat protein